MHNRPRVAAATDASARGEGSGHIVHDGTTPAMRAHTLWRKSRVLATRVGDRARSRMGGLVCLALVVFVLMAGGQNSEGREDSRLRQGFSFASLRSLVKGGAPPSIVVLVDVSPVVGPGSRADRIKAIEDTWAHSAPHHVQVVYVSDDVGADSALVPPSVPFLSAPKPPVGAVEDKLSRMAWSMQQALDTWPSLQWVVLANDHAFLLPPNLAAYLAQHYSPSQPHYLGHALEVDPGRVFHSNAAGAVLSRAALDMLLPAVAAGTEPLCVAKSDWEKNNAGVVMGQCLHKLGIEAQHTKAGDGERFNIYGPSRLVTSQVDEWYLRYHPGETQPEGLQCCASDLISFHYVGPKEARAMWTILTHQRFRTKVLREDVLKEAQWPTEPQDLGGYAHPAVSPLVPELLLNKITLAQL